MKQKYIVLTLLILGAITVVKGILTQISITSGSLDLTLETQTSIINGTIAWFAIMVFFSLESRD